MSKRVSTLVAAALLLALLIPASVFAVRGTVEPALAVSGTLAKRAGSCAGLNLDLVPPCIVWSVQVKGFSKTYVDPREPDRTPPANHVMGGVWVELSGPPDTTYDIGVDKPVTSFGEIDPGEAGWDRKALKYADLCSGLGQVSGCAYAEDAPWRITHEPEWTESPPDGMRLQEPVTIPC